MLHRYKIRNYSLAIDTSETTEQVLCDQCASLALMGPHQEVECLGRTDEKECSGCGNAFYR